MKLQSLFFTLLLLLLTLQSYFAQEKPKAILFMEFEETNCDSLQVNLYEFLLQINKSPNSKGYILMNGSKNKGAPFKKYFWEMEMKTGLAFIGMDKDQIIFLEGKDKADSRTQFWVVPEGADKPDFIEEKWDYKFPAEIKPLVINKDSWIGEVCHASYNTDFYSKVLLANPDVKGHLVIYSKSINGFRKRENELLKELVNENKVPRKQLKFFYVKSKAADVEYWFVPNKSK